MKILFKILFLGLAIITSGCATRKMLKPGEIPPPPQLSLESRAKANSIVNSFTNETGLAVSTDKKATARLKRISDRLLITAGYDPQLLPVKLVQSGDEVNAMAVEGSAIIVFDTLLKRVPVDAELAAVIAHEIGHLLGGHANEQSEEERAENLNTGSSILGTLSSVGLSIAGLGGVSNIAGSAVSDVTQIVGYGSYVRAFDRSQEFEADQTGLVIMAKAGYDPRAAVSLWQRTTEIFGEDADVKGSFYSTHPGSEDRISRLEEIMPVALNYYHPK